MQVKYKLSNYDFVITNIACVSCFVIFFVLYCSFFNNIFLYSQISIEKKKNNYPI